MLFEAACFDGVNIRKSVKEWDCVQMLPENLKKDLIRTMRWSLNRACQLVEELGAGEVVGGAVDVYSTKKDR